jgi:YkoY family integral membrane protein
MNILIRQIVDDPLTTLLIIGNLILIESLLSVDNAAVMAAMVMHLPQKDRGRALKYGIIGAYVFRGLCLLLATYLVHIWWLKGVGGLYLVYLFLNWFFKRNKPKEQDEDAVQPKGKLYNYTLGRLGNFWATIITVEIMDLAFSLDNVFAAVAFSNNILIILAGVFIGILAMRFVAQIFVKLMEKFKFLEACAYTVIGILGIKLSLSFYEHFNKGTFLSSVLESNRADWITSACTIAIFFIPIITSLLFNFPKRNQVRS